MTKEEILEAKREGTKILGLRTPVGLITDDGGRLTGVQFVQNRLGGWRAGGRRQAIPIEGSEFVEPCDTLLIAIGQKTVNDYLDLPVELDRWGAVKVDEHGMTSVEGLFAAGDFVIGASTVVEAVGLGRKTALEMDTWLMGRERRKLVVKIEPVEEPRRDRAWDFIPPQHIPMEPMKSRFDTLDARGREGLRPGPRGRGGQALLSLPPQVRDRPRQLHLLPRLHRGRAAQLHQAGERHRHQGRRQLRRAGGDQPSGTGSARSGSTTTSASAAAPATWSARRSASRSPRTRSSIRTSEPSRGHRRRWRRQHHVIIGNGVAGNRAAAVLRERDPDNRITIISIGGLLFYDRYQLPQVFQGKRDWRDVSGLSAGLLRGPPDHGAAQVPGHPGRPAAPGADRSRTARRSATTTC